ncbi:MAG TPA: ABC transporter permease [Bryobacteraceae bacterium]|nr:ABC transporter permease [Bryobacteraceae bacterium]
MDGREMKGIGRWKSAPVFLGIASFAAILLVWESVVRLGWVNPFFVSQPSAIAASLSRSAQSGELWRNLAVSLREFAIGYGASVVVGFLAGALAGRFRTVEYALDPFLWFLYSAPLIAFYPIFVIWFGLGIPTVIAIAFLLSVTQITFSTLSGIQNVNPLLLRAAKSFGATERDVLWKVVLPASVPMVIAGLRLGIGRALMGVVVGELFGATAGLGYSISYYGSLLKTTDMLASLVVIVVLGVLCTQALSALEARFDSWRTGPDS